jgi:predicted transcriptional regulator
MVEKSALIDMTAEIVSAYVGNNLIDPTKIPDLIQETYNALASVEDAGLEQRGQKPEPAVDIASSVSDEYIVCLEDGKKFKSLKRHLRTSYGLSPEQYRIKWGLDADYPMVAPNYAKARSKLAKEMGLGQSKSSKD